VPYLHRKHRLAQKRIKTYSPTRSLYQRVFNRKHRLAQKRIKTDRVLLCGGHHKPIENTASLRRGLRLRARSHTCKARNHRKHRLAQKRIKTLRHLAQPLKGQFNRKHRLAQKRIKTNFSRKRLHDQIGIENTASLRRGLRLHDQIGFPVRERIENTASLRRGLRHEGGPDGPGVSDDRKHRLAQKRIKTCVAILPVSSFADRKHRLAQKRIKTTRPSGPCPLRLWIENTASLRRGLRQMARFLAANFPANIENTASLRRGLRLPRARRGELRQ